MIALNIFDSSVVLHHCHDREIYDNQDIRNSLGFVFSLDEIRSNVDQSQLGNAFSTCGYYDKFPLPLMPGAENLSEWIAKRILESSEFFGVKDPLKVEFTRTWANIMYVNCEGKCHKHHLDIDGVAIFYPRVNSNTGELVFINNGIDGMTVDQALENQIFRQKLVPGDLLIHPPTLPHAVAKHCSQDPRISFIYEFKYH